MIHGVTGHLGGGKSLHCVKLMVDQLRIGQPVATNIELDLEWIKKAWGLKHDLESIYYPIDVDADPWTFPRGAPRGTVGPRVVIVIDEAGEWITQDNVGALRQLKSWLRHSDKQGQDVYLIVQDASILAKAGRVLVHRWLYTRNMGQWEIPGVGWHLPAPWKFEQHVFHYDQTGRNLLKKQVYLRDKRVYKAYNTAALFGHSAEAAGVGAVTVGETKAKGFASWSRYIVGDCVGWACVWFACRLLLRA